VHASVTSSSFQPFYFGSTVLLRHAASTTFVKAWLPLLPTADYDKSLPIADFQQSLPTADIFLVAMARVKSYSPEGKYRV
jgi:hypothetical protein